MQGKLIIKKGEEKKFQSACYFSGVKILDSLTVGNETHAEVSTNDINNIWKACLKMSEVDGTEIETIKKRNEAKEAALKAKKAAGKGK